MASRPTRPDKAKSAGKAATTARTKAATSDAHAATDATAERREPLGATAQAASSATPSPDAPEGVTPGAEPPALRKQELIASVAERSGAKKRIVKPIVEATIDALAEAVGEGRDLNLQPFGKVKQNRVKDAPNARIVFAKIRQNKAAGAGVTPAKDTVADAAE